MFIIEDAHWIDAVSESMIADLLTVIPHTQSMVLITSRPEYHGALTRVHGAQTIALAPPDDSDTAALLGELVPPPPPPPSLRAALFPSAPAPARRGKQTLNAASVIGARFGAELLAALGIDAPPSRCVTSCDLAKAVQQRAPPLAITPDIARRARQSAEPPPG